MKTRTVLLLILCVSLTILSGVLRGMVDQRWGMNEAAVEAAVRVEALPEQLGKWKAAPIVDADGNRVDKLDDEAKKMLRCVGNTVRNYVHEDTGESVSLVFMVGPAGPLAIHTPEVCYGSANFTTAEPRQQRLIKSVNDGEHPFSVITFEENRVGKRLLRVYYAWNTGGEWRAPNTPRTSFAGVPMLYKLQLATNSIDESTNMDAAEKFLIENLSTLKDICR